MTANLQRKTRHVFMWLAAVPALLGICALWAAAEYRNSIDWVLHSREVLERLDSLTIALSSAEAAQRGYLLTHDPAYLSPFQQTLENSSDTMSELRSLTADNPAQQSSIADLSKLVRDRTRRLQEILESFGTEAVSPDIARQALEEGRVQSEQIAALTQRMAAEEARLLRERERAQSRMEVYTAATFTVGFGACLGLLYWAQLLLRRYSAARDSADLSVRQLNDELRQQVEQKNELNAELQRSVAEIHRLNTDLEGLVDERTAELQAANAQLLRSNEDLTRFAYVASHDLQEPLRIIGSYAGLLAKRYHGKLDERADKYIHYVVDGAKRMQTLVQDLLAYSRAGTQALKRERISLDSVAAQAAADLRMAIADAGAIVTRDPLPVINGDARKLTQVLTNLLSNAIKFRKPGEIPRVHVRAQRAGEFWTISVEDNGIGFEQEFADRIFVVFQRLHEIGAYPGTGIGLAICKRIVEAHGGRIWAESQPGAGSSFRFTIPTVDVREDVADPEHHAIPEQQNA